MRIKEIFIDGHKNLNGTLLELSDETHVQGIIGNNGSGKSNVLEALTIVFSKARRSIPVEFKYRVTYTKNEHEYIITNKKDEEPVTCDGKKVLKKDLDSIFPNNIFLYYCGETPRLKELALEYVDNEFENSVKGFGGIKCKYITCLTVDDFGPALLANTIYDNNITSQIHNLVNIKEVHLDRIIIKFKRPSWNKDGSFENKFDATGTVGQQLDYLVNCSISQRIEEVKNEANIGEITINDMDMVKNYWDSAYNLFTMFKMLSQADVLHQIDFDVTKNNKFLKFSYTNLSEGEKQLAQLLSILELTKDEENLYLLDEFDSYLHPNWQREYTNLISSIESNGQIIFTTHSPATIGKLQAEDITVLKKGEGIKLSVDTYNRDISELLEEVMEVSLRPLEIQKKINIFNHAILKKDLKKALLINDELRTMLPERDPFFIMSAGKIKRLETRL